MRAQRQPIAGLVSLLVGLGTIAAVCQTAIAGPDAPDTAWTHYGGSSFGRQYSGLAEINRDNVALLEEAWRFRTGELGEGHREPFAFQANPILVEGTLYLPTGSAIVIALDPATGQERWRFDPEIDRSRGHAEIANRGVSSWIDVHAAADAVCRHRIFVGTLDARLIALDGRSGEPCEGFGHAGEIRLDADVRAEPGDWVDYTVTSPPAIVGDAVIIGSAIGDNRAVESELGIVRALDARTGIELWRWDPIPRSEDDPAFGGWLPVEARRNGSANAWAPLAADSDLGLVYVPTGSPSPDFYGGERSGDNRYANSLVALRVEDGSVKWHRQLVHHDVWDYDLASQPTLVELERNGDTLRAVLQGTKTGLIFAFDRSSGEAVFEIEERPVPLSDVPGEHLSPTQPFPVMPPILSRHGPLREDDAWGLTPFDRWACRKRIATLRSEGIFTPPSVGGTLLLPGYAGGINWGGIAFDPGRQLALTFVNDLPMQVALIRRDGLEDVRESGDFNDFEIAEMTGTPYAMRRSLLGSPLGLPCIEPPWGALVAVDMRSGEIAWRRKIGSIQDLAPAIVPNLELGTPAMGGPIVTGGGLVFMAGTMDDYLRAFDVDTGETLWEGRLPAGGQATPMTYYLESTGKQYVVLAAGGHARMGTTPGDYVIAWALPD